MKPLAWREAYHGADNVWQSRRTFRRNIYPLPGLRAALPVTGLVGPPSLKLMTLGDSRSDCSPAAAHMGHLTWDSHMAPATARSQFSQGQGGTGGTATRLISTPHFGVVPEKPRTQHSGVGRGLVGGSRVSFMLEHPLLLTCSFVPAKGHAAPSSQLLGQPVLGLLGKCLYWGDMSKTPRPAPSGAPQPRLLGPGCRPAPPHPAPPGPCSKPTSPGIRHSRHCGCRRNSSRHRAATRAAWPAADCEEWTKEGWTPGPAEGEWEGWELNTIKLEPLWGLIGVGQLQEPPQHF